MLQRNILWFNKMIQPSSVKKIYSWCNCYRYIVLRKSLVSFFLKPKNNWLTLIRGKRVHCCWPTLLPSFEFPHQTNFIKHAMVINMPSYKFLRQNIPLEKSWLELFTRYLSTEFNTINSPSWKELLQLYFPSKRTTLKSNYREKTAWVGGTIDIIGDNSKVINTILSALGLP